MDMDMGMGMDIDIGHGPWWRTKAVRSSVRLYEFDRTVYTHSVCAPVRALR